MSIPYLAIVCFATTEQARRIRRIVALQSLIRGAIVRKTVAEFGALRFLDFVEFPDEHAASHSRQTTDVDTLYKPLRRTASSLLRSESTATAKLLQQHPLVRSLALFRIVPLVKRTSVLNLVSCAFAGTMHSLCLGLRGQATHLYV